MIDTERTSTEDVRSRLWQDPFQAVEQHLKQFPSGNESDKSSLSVSGTISQKMEGLAPGDCNKPIIANSIKELHCLIGEELEGKKSLYILAVMVPGGPYAEDHEWRMRSRYALISGLYTGNYVPQDAEHIKFINFKDTCKKALEAEKEICHFPDYVPYEFFEPIKQSESISKTSILNKENKVLVLWLNNDTFARSPNILETLKQLKEQVQPDTNTSKIKFDIIGPLDSGTSKKLRKRINEAQTAKTESGSSSYLDGTQIFSPFVTADPDQLEITMNDWYAEAGKWWIQKYYQHYWYAQQLSEHIAL